MDREINPLSKTKLRKENLCPRCVVTVYEARVVALTGDSEDRDGEADVALEGDSEDQDGEAGVALAGDPEDHWLEREWTTSGPESTKSSKDGKMNDSVEYDLVVAG